MDNNKPGVSGGKAISVMPDGMRVVIAIVFAFIAFFMGAVFWGSIRDVHK